MEIKHIDIALLEGNNGQVDGLPANPRKWTQREVERIAASLQETPELLEARPLVVVPNGSKYVVLGGNLRLAGIKHNQGTTAPCAVLPQDTSTDKLKEIVIKDNSSFGEWDLDLLSAEWEDMPLDDWGVKLAIDEDVVLPDDDGTEVVDNQVSNDEDLGGSLIADFIVSPTSILDTRTGAWNARKNKWHEIMDFDSKIGRDENLTNTSQSVQYYKERAKHPEMNSEEFYKFAQENGIKVLNTTSVFDPVLCEILLMWFNVPNGRVLDPFAGGSVRGLVSGKLGMPYVGNDISANQIAANIEQLKKNTLSVKPIWTIGASQQLPQILADNHIERDFDMILSCPPYADLEVYSDDEMDISNMPYDKFLQDYRAIIAQSCDMLNTDRFAVFVVSEVRDKKGYYRGFVKDTIEAFEAAGVKFYNEIILINQCPSIVTVRRPFASNRKVKRTHQNVLVFFKGDVKKISKKFPSTTKAIV